MEHRLSSLGTIWKSPCSSSYFRVSKAPYLVPCHPVWHQYLTIILKREIKFTDASSMSHLPNKFLKVICKEKHRSWIMYKSNGSIRQFKTYGFFYSIYLPCSGSSSKKCCAVSKLIFSPTRWNIVMQLFPTFWHLLNSVQEKHWW